MKKEIRVVDEKKGIVQVTSVDERFYAVPGNDAKTGLPTYMFYPSVTYITGFYPKGRFFEEWLKKMGNEAETIKQLAGEKGSKIHQAIAFLIDKQPVNMQSQFINTTTGQLEEISAEEYEAVVTFAAWFKKTKPEVIEKDFVVVDDKLGYAGSVDLFCKIGEELWIVDFKTGQSIYPSYELQLSAYRQAKNVQAKLAVLQIGYARNKDGYKFTEVEDKFELFTQVFGIFKNEVGDKKPRQVDLPLEVKL